MRDMSMGWPRWLAFIALAAVTWGGLTALDPDRNRLVGAAYASLAGDLASDPALASEGEVQVRTDGGELCERAVVRGFGAHTPEASLVVHCKLAEGRAELSISRVGEQAALASRSRALASELSLMPPLMAIFFAFLFRQVVLALLGGICFGAVITAEFQPLASIERAGVDYLWGTLVDPFNLYVFGFTLILIGMVNVCIANGGMRGVIDQVSRFAKGVRSTQAATALMGFFVFFDDYANTVVVGGAARPLTDSMKISRAKLAYIVDSTAAPIAGVAIVSTWIGIEIEYFGSVLNELGPMSNIVDNGYAFFFEVLPYRFYCFFAVALVLLVALTGRDFGPMLRVEQSARRGGTRGPTGYDPKTAEARRAISHVAMKDGVPTRWINGVLPITVVVFVTVFGSIWSGSEPYAAELTKQGREMDWLSLGDLATAFTKVSESAAVLFWASVFGVMTAMLMSVGQRILSVKEAARAFWRGALGMLSAIGILVLAMALKEVAKDLQAAHYLAALMGDIGPLWLPLISFVIAGAVAFATGTSWGTMAILVPVCLPLTAELAHALPGAEVLLFLVGASVLDGAIFGDHCSLISDTTVMSSISTGCDHVEHVRTQIPYALLAMSAAGLCGYLFVAMAGGAAWWLCYPMGLSLMMGWLYLIGRRPEDDIA
ncbi:MAG: Na+/H+ antiporter NhaC family protein [Myxococcota bacterium]